MPACNLLQLSSSNLKHHLHAPLQIVGRLAAQLSILLQGKDKPIFAPHKDQGDVCIVVNAEKAVFTGNKWEGKVYKWHTGEVVCIKVFTPQQSCSSYLPGSIAGCAAAAVLPAAGAHRYVAM